MANADLLKSVREGRSGDVVRLLMVGANVNARNTDLETPLMFAAGNGDVHIMNILFRNGANLDAEDGSGSTALLWAAVALSVGALQFLITKGANVNARDVDNFGAIHWVRARSLVDSFDASRRYGGAVSFDASRRYLQLIQLLILGGASLDDLNTAELSNIYDHINDDGRQIIENSSREYAVEPEMEDF